MRNGIQGKAFDFRTKPNNVQADRAGTHAHGKAVSKFGNSLASFNVIIVQNQSTDCDDKFNLPVGKACDFAQMFDSSFKVWEEYLGVGVTEVSG